MRAIGIDPGVATTGYAVVERRQSRLVPVAVGVVRTLSGRPQAERLASLRAQLASLIDRHRPEVAVVERLFFNANVRTAMAVGQASGAVLVAVADAGVEVVDYTPSEVKLSVTGAGNAAKRQVGRMVARLLGMGSPPSPADAADACALAICHLHRAGLRRALEGATA